MKKLSKNRGFLRALTLFAALVLLGFLYLVLIVAQPQDEEKEEFHLAEQAPLAATQAVYITAEDELGALLKDFPIPAMSYLSGSGMKFMGGNAADFAWQGGFGRKIHLDWEDPEGKKIQLESVYPASALEILGDGDYHFSRYSGPTLFSRDSVRMENTDWIRVHTQTETGLYILYIEREDGISPADAVRSIQLFELKN